MRDINAKDITNTVAELCIKANKVLPNDLEECIKKCSKVETDELPKSIMNDLCENLIAARELDIPICQDTGMAVIFIEIGQEVHIVNGDLNTAINNGVRKGYTDGLLRCSVVSDPLNRVNTQDNTPAIIHTKIVSGDKLKLTVAPKGFGSENMSTLKMFTPSATKEDIINYILESVKIASSNPCPPVVLGIGIGGDFEQCAYLAKKALCRSISVRNKNEFYKNLEEEILDRVNELNIGPQGFGGETTALAINIEYAPTHIAGLPVSINVGCHVTRHAEKIM